MDFTLWIKDEPFIKVEEYGAKYIIIGLYEILFVLPILLYCHFICWPFTLLGLLLIYYGVIMLLRRDVYNKDMLLKVDKVLANPEKYEQTEGILSYTMYIVTSSAIPIMIFSLFQLF